MDSFDKQFTNIPEFRVSFTQLKIEVLACWMKILLFCPPPLQVGKLRSLNRVIYDYSSEFIIVLSLVLQEFHASFDSTISTT